MKNKKKETKKERKKKKVEKIGIKSYFLTNNMRNKTYLVTH